MVVLLVVLVALLVVLVVLLLVVEVVVFLFVVDVFALARLTVGALVAAELDALSLRRPYVVTMLLVVDAGPCWKVAFELATYVPCKLQSTVPLFAFEICMSCANSQDASFVHCEEQVLMCDCVMGPEVASHDFDSVSVDELSEARLLLTCQLILYPLAGVNAYFCLLRNLWWLPSIRDCSPSRSCALIRVQKRVNRRTSVGNRSAMLGVCVGVCISLNECVSVFSEGRGMPSIQGSVVVVKTQEVAMVWIVMDRQRTTTTSSHLTSSLAFASVYA